MLLAVGKMWCWDRKSYNPGLVERKIVKMTRVLAHATIWFLTKWEHYNNMESVRIP
jgi:hypothetical protein